MYGHIKIYRKIKTSTLSDVLHVICIKGGLLPKYPTIIYINNLQISVCVLCIHNTHTHKQTHGTRMMKEDLEKLTLTGHIKRKTNRVERRVNFLTILCQ